MSVLWAVFLLSSLLAPSQGFRIMPSAAKGDDTRYSQAKHDLQKLQRGGLGGGLLGGLLKKDTPLGGLLGEDGVLGSLLGGGGVLGGLLDKQGVVGGLLDKQGVLGGLLDKQGVVGGLLDKDGVLGGLLDKQGVVGGLLDKDGVLGGLLDKQGVVGGLLDKDGVLGGVLGKDGVLDGLLGKDGLVDALLGKNGLVDSLLDAVLDILIGKGGLLSKDGLAGSILGGNGGDLPGMKIVNNTLPKISLRLLPGFGHHVGFHTQLLVEGASDLCVQVEADVDMLVQDKWAAPQSGEDCKTFEINISVRPEVPLLDQPLKRLLSDAVREAGCDIVGTRLSAVSSLLSPGTPALPLGALGDLPPFSIISSDAIQLDVNLLGGWEEGDVVAPAQGPALAASLLLATGHPPRLSLPPRALRALLQPVLGRGVLNISIANSMVPDSISLSTSALLPLIPQLSRMLPGSLPLELRVRVADEPVVTVRDRRATATLKASIDVLSPALQTSQNLLFSLDADIVLNIIPSVSDSRLRTSLALDSINLTRTPLRLDPLSVSPLAGWLQQVLAAAYVPAINDVLSVSIPLPNVLNTSLRNVQVDITEADGSLDQVALERSCSGGPLALVTG